MYTVVPRHMSQTLDTDSESADDSDAHEDFDSDTD